jgi:hypothetical protein
VNDICILSYFFTLVDAGLLSAVLAVLFDFASPDLFKVGLVTLLLSDDITLLLLACAMKGAGVVDWFAMEEE